ncbi:hypothetical protein OG500_32870 [Kitasatospora sp. NBC_01250]|uniref:AAA family ATPase n=1 Tax=unclassified Kitasatospora TaxID=2633591 RepID=UPI002E125FF2|nr:MULTISPECIES: AAA family ATPase [unclassified Kitasatospora]WSJ70780.1 hypothetical protein OG294_34410 [Kitasatospora sp. NBC_01302]
MITGRRYAALDGHDGCGKSTLAQAVAERVGAQVLKPYPDSLGDHIAWLWGGERFAEADALARSSIERVLEKSDPARPVLFDRCWSTMFTVLPESYWQAWYPLCPTVLCHADTKVVMDRLAERGEDPGDFEEHEYYQRLYRSHAALSPDTLLLDTSERPFEACVTDIVEFLSW